MLDLLFEETTPKLIILDKKPITIHKLHFSLAINITHPSLLMQTCYGTHEGTISSSVEKTKNLLS